MSTAAAYSPPKTRFRRISSVFLVDSIEPCLEFWTDRLGFETRLQVQGDLGLDFVVLGRDDVEIMYRTRSSLVQGSPEVLGADDHQPWVVLYLQVADLDEILPRLDGVEIVVPARENPFGIREVYVREPSGRILAISSCD
jgi:catechol 2,3-dioxygenase-like lactoylglutathione lyase family enzyme